MSSVGAVAPPLRAETPAAGRVLTLAPVRVAPVYSGSYLTYRTGPHGIETDPYARLASPPGSMLGAAIRGYLAASDFVRDVVHPGDGVAAEARIEVYASELVGLLGADPAGILTLQFRVVVPTANPAGGGTEILLKTYSRSVPISRRTADAVVEAWNRGLGEIMGEFEADLKTALASRP
jgi:ABC-type transport auxiliary lipoprotein component